MRHIGDIRCSGSIIIHGGKDYTANPAALRALCREVKAESVWGEPVVIMDGDNAVGSLFPSSEFPTVKRLVMFIDQNEYQVYSADFVRVMQESQFAAQIFDTRPIEVSQGQATLGGYA